MSAFQKAGLKLIREVSVQLILIRHYPSEASL